MNLLVSLFARQLLRDLLHAPSRARARWTDVGRVARCGNIAELRTAARREVPRAVFDFLDGGAEDEVTLRANEADLAALRLAPRVLAGTDEVDLSTAVFGRRLAIPLIGAPTGLTGLLHPRGELAVARAVDRAGSLYALSALASTSIEELAREVPGPSWFQLYLWRDRGITRDLVQRAQASGYGALVVTVDVPRLGSRDRDRRNSFGVPPRLTPQLFADSLRRPRWTSRTLRDPRVMPGSIAAAREGGAADPASHVNFINGQFDPALTWADIAWARAEWAGPLVVKGILRPDDARRAVVAGADGVVVSNHGGRQLDGAVSGIAALPAVVDAVGGVAEVFMDGGIRRGTDIVKALALGARACLIGRALVYGLAAGGDAGTERALTILVEELRLALALAGCNSVAELDRTLLHLEPVRP
jgi:L-lactate dehydrogenase (cytochrome)